MPIRTCSSCGAEWTSALVKCPLCGGEATERAAPTGKIVLKTKATVPPTPPPPPPPAAEGAEPDVVEEIRKELAGIPPMEVPPQPEPEPPAPPVVAHVEPQKEPTGTARPPSNTLPLVLAILSLLGCAILPLTLRYDYAKIFGLVAVPRIGYAAAGLFALLAPFSWFRARTRASQLLGMLATFGYVASFATLMILEAIARWAR